MSVVLRHPYFLSGELVIGHADRYIFGEITSSDDHRTGVDTGLAYASLEFCGIIEHILCLFRAVCKLFLELRDQFIAVLELRLVGNLFLILLELFLYLYLAAWIFRIIDLHFLLDQFLSFFQSVSFIERIFCVLHLYDRLVRNHLREPVGLFDGHTAYAGHVLDG